MLDLEDILEMLRMSDDKTPQEKEYLEHNLKKLSIAFENKFNKKLTIS